MSEQQQAAGNLAVKLEVKCSRQFSG